MSRLDISFIIPCYNAGSYLEAAIESILAQKGDFEIVEIIVVDDRSDDPATKSALATVARLEKVKVVANTGPKGAAGARNAGLDIARGEWIAFFDADDVLT
ncbi:MAG: glycosyltransferase family A protein, partial [Alphaproteobacteria bacterium]